MTELRGPAEAEGSGEVIDNETTIVINGGGRGLLVRMTLQTLLKALDNPQLVDVIAAPKGDKDKT